MPLPEGYYWGQEREWTCPVHHEPEHDRWDEEDEGINFDFPVYGCTCRTRAKWKWTGWWEPKVGLTGLAKILADLYVPAMCSVLNEPILLSRLADGTPVTVVNEVPVVIPLHELKPETRKRRWWQRTSRTSP